MHLLISLVCTLHCTSWFKAYIFRTATYGCLWLGKKISKKLNTRFTIKHWKTCFLVPIENFDLLKTTWKNLASGTKFFWRNMHTMTPFLLHESAVPMSHQPWKTVKFSLHNNEMKNTILVLLPFLHYRTHALKWKSDNFDWKSGTTL